jgi:hypothetical protein
MAAGLRDCLRAAQFYTRDISLASMGQGQVPFLSRAVGWLAKFTDRVMTWSVDTVINLFVPHWRKLPSPFAPGMMDEVGKAIAENSLVSNPAFNAYFFRAAVHITRRYSEPPYLILEHRVDAARRLLASERSSGASSEAEFMARILIGLVDAAPVARVGRAKPPLRLFDSIDPNIAIFSVACLALLFAEEGKPLQMHDEEEFFSIVGALILPRLKAIESLASKHDVVGLARELKSIKEMY